MTCKNTMVTKFVPIFVDSPFGHILGFLLWLLCLLELIRLLFLSCISQCRPAQRSNSFSLLLSRWTHHFVSASKILCLLLIPLVMKSRVFGMSDGACILECTVPLQPFSSHLYINTLVPDCPSPEYPHLIFYSLTG